MYSQNVTSPVFFSIGYRIFGINLYALYVEVYSYVSISLVPRDMQKQRTRSLEDTRATLSTFPALSRWPSTVANRVTQSRIATLDQKPKNCKYICTHLISPHLISSRSHDSRFFSLTHPFARLYDPALPCPSPNPRYTSPPIQETTRCNTHFEPQVAACSILARTPRTPRPVRMGMIGRRNHGSQSMLD